MKCKNCKHEIGKTDRFCRYCGYKLIEDANDVTLPKPKRKKDGTYAMTLMVDGNRFTFSAPTIKEIIALGTSYKLGAIKPPEKVIPETDEIITLGDIITQYLEKNSNILSPSTLRSYISMSNNRFQDAMLCDYRVIDYQVMVNIESTLVKPKTIKNAFALVAAALSAYGYKVPSIHLPKVPVSDRPFLDATQIKALIDYMKGNKYELAVLLGLHGLRVSEMLALTREDITDNIIHINKAAVTDKDGNLVIKQTNKNKSSTRDVQILIDRVKEIIPESGNVVPFTSSAINHAIHRACVKVGVADCGTHDLRRSFASLCYYLKLSDKFIMRTGGWSNTSVMHQVYVKLYDSEIEDGNKLLQNYFKGSLGAENALN